LNGGLVTETRDFPKGDPQEPLTPAEIEQKFLDNASARYSTSESCELVRLMRGLPQLKDVAPLFSLLAR
jgi:hypothetical protein